MTEVAEFDTNGAETLQLSTLYQRLQTLENSKRDIVAPAQSLFSNKGQMQLIMETGPRISLDMTDVAMRQVCERLGIPGQYAEKMRREMPDLFDKNINGWLSAEMEKEKQRNFMLRTYEGQTKTAGTLRAFLSDKFFDISSFRILQELLATVAEIQKESGIVIEPQICSLTDKNIYVRFIAPKFEIKSKVLKYFKDARTGNRHPGFFTGAIFRNSEVGYGMYEVAPRMITGACQNGNIYTSESFARKHIGGAQEIGDVKWSKDTIEAEILTITSKTKDLLRVWLSKAWLGNKVEEIEALADTKLAYPMDCVVNLADDLGLPAHRAKSVIEWMNGCGMGDTAFGLLQSFTGAAKGMHGDWQWDLEAKATARLLGDGWKKYDHPNRQTKKIILN